MLHLTTVHEHQRLSTQDLLLRIEEAVERGETDFVIEASGQHDIGGPLWNREGRPLRFVVTNPGQRVGGMCMPDTEVIVNGPAPADVGWLNAGGRIIVRGDAGDTAGHCAAAGRIYIGGRAGTRSGSLMKHDPLYEAPELWVLQSVGSFSFEFMGGGKAVVCGWNSQTLSSVLGERPCVGMVGGVIYVRGPLGDLPPDVAVHPLDEDDIAFLDAGLEAFLDAVERPRLRRELTVWKHWRKILPAPHAADSHEGLPDMHDFRRNRWVENGIFSDVFPDDFSVRGLVVHDADRLRRPVWENARHDAPCEHACPAGIPSQRRFNLLRQGRVDEALRLVLEHSPFPASVCGHVCPNLCQTACSRNQLDDAIQIGALGRLSAETALPVAAPASGKSVGIIGGGVGGLSAAWQLVHKGHAVTVYEADEEIGGKLRQVIPHARLDEDVLAAELQRIRDAGVTIRTGCRVDAERFAALRKEHDAVIVATGGHKARIFPWPGKERVVAGIDFLKAVNRGESPAVPERVVVIGCGNAGMDVAAGAFACGARDVTCIDVQKPAAFAHEMAHIESLGGKIVWPVRTREITEQGLVDEEGRLFPADMVIISVGETPELDFVPETAPRFRDWLSPAADGSVLDNVFAVGDVVRPGLLVDAIGSGRRVAEAVDARLRGTVAEAARTQRQCVPAASLHTAWFAPCPADKRPDAAHDYERCISCGTCRDCSLCLTACPQQAISRTVEADGSATYASDPTRCIGCGICAGVCPCGIWKMQVNTSAA